MACTPTISVQFLLGMFFHTFWIRCQGFSKLIGAGTCCLNCLFTIDHKFAIGLRPGFCAGYHYLKILLTKLFFHYLGRVFWSTILLKNYFFCRIWALFYKLQDITAKFFKSHLSPLYHKFFPRPRKVIAYHVISSLEFFFQGKV